MLKVFKNAKSKIILQNICLYIADMALVALALYLSILFRFDMIMPKPYVAIFSNTLPILLVITSICLILGKLYNNAWQYASIETMFKVTLVCAISILASYFICSALNKNNVGAYLASRGIFFTLATLLIALIGGLRFTLKIINFKTDHFQKYRGLNKRIMIIGAGWAGGSIIRDIRAGRMGKAVPVIAIDDDSTRVGTRINGVLVRGGTDKIALYADIYKIDEIVIAIATPKGRIQDLIDDCIQTGRKVSRVTNLRDISENHNATSEIRDIDLNDLLGRPEENINIEPIKEHFKNKTVLITGGGGTIGSEICKQIVPFNTNKIILFDISENYIYDLKNELLVKFGSDIDSKIELCVGSVRDIQRLNEVFSMFKPDIVLHAAAHKHVPLMEACPTQAVKNNIFGTYNTAKCAIENNVQSFVLISTDKAVNPTNVMGATKRLSELIIQGLNSNKTTNFTIVRFGNVLGSHGSVVPIFENQIRNGGPVTVTDKNIIRYFMSVQEATKLVLAAASISKGGELFVLDMGEPMRIYDLAKRMVRMYSDPDKAPVEIVITGLRKGEKLYEELLMNDENIVRTDIEKVFITKADEVTLEEINAILNKLEIAMENKDDIRQCLMELLPNFKNAEEVNKNTDKDRLNRHRVYSNE